MIWGIEIEKVKNGYIIEHISDDEEQQASFVVEEDDTEDAELKAMQDLLLHIKEYFAVNYSKHNKKNLLIDIVETKNDNI